MKSHYRVKPYKCAKKPHLKFVVNWNDADGKRQRKYCETKGEAETFAQKGNIEVANQGRESLSLSTETRVMAQRCQAQLEPFGMTIDDATRHFLEYLRERGASRKLSLLLVEFNAQKKAQGLCKQYRHTLNKQLGDFIALHPDKLASDITLADCNAFLATRDVGAISRNYTRGCLVSFFAFAVAGGYCEKNPALKVAKVKVPETPVGVLTPDQLARLLEAACPVTLPYIAIGAFAGVRSAELQRLDWSEIDLSEGFIEIRAAKSKTAARRLIRIQPCLRAWLEPIAKKQGPVCGVCPGNMWAAMVTTRERAGIPDWPKNALRHSFASYHLAQFKDAPALALEMGHEGCNMIFAHYRQVVRQSEALKYWNILPSDSSKVLEMAMANQSVARVIQPRNHEAERGAPFVCATPWRLSYAKTQRDYARQYGVKRGTIRKWQDLGRPLDDPEAMRAILKQRYKRPLGEYCAIYGKKLNAIKTWAKAGWPLDDEAAIREYIARQKFKLPLTARAQPARSRIVSLPRPSSNTVELRSIGRA